MKSSLPALFTVWYIISYISIGDATYRGYDGKTELPLGSCLQRSDVEEFGWYSKPGITSNYVFDVHNWNSSIATGYLGAYLLKDAMNRPNTSVVFSEIWLLLPYANASNPYSSIGNRVTTFDMEVWDVNGVSQSFQSVLQARGFINQADNGLQGKSGIYMSLSMKTAFPAKDLTLHTSLADAAVLAALPSWNDQPTGKVKWVFHM